MSDRTEIKPGQPVPIVLSAAERSLLLREIWNLDGDLANMLVEMPPDEPVPLLLDDLVGLGRRIAVAANCTKDKRLMKRLDQLFERIDTLLDSYVEVEAPTTLSIFDTQFTDGATVGAKLKAFVSYTLFLAEACSQIRAADPFHQRSEENVRLDLTKEQRDLLGALQSLPEQLAAKVRWHAEEPESIMVSIDELALLLVDLADACSKATSVELKQYQEVASILASSLSKSLEIGDAYSLQTSRTIRLNKRTSRPSKTSADGTNFMVGVPFTASQRKIVAELSPELAGRLQLDRRNQRTVQLTQEEITLLANRVEAALSNAKNGMRKNSLRHIANALAEAGEESEA